MPHLCSTYNGFGIDGRTILHQKLDAYQMSSVSSPVEKGPVALHHTCAAYDNNNAANYVPVRKMKIGNHIRRKLTVLTANEPCEKKTRVGDSAAISSHILQTNRH